MSPNSALLRGGVTPTAYMECVDGSIHTSLFFCFVCLFVCRPFAGTIGHYFAGVAAREIVF